MCNEEANCKRLIYLCLPWERLLKFQRVLNDQQKRQQYPVRCQFLDVIV